MKKLSLLLLSILIVSSSCVSLEKSPVSGKKRAYGYSWEKEIEIGREADKSIVAEYGIYDNQALTNYVDEMGQELLEVSHLRREDSPSNYRNTEFTFRVLDSPVVNAFALPGGFVYVTRGLLGHLENEAQLAVVLGHEIAHVAARHASQRAAEQQFGQIALIGGAVVGESLGLNGGGLLQSGSQAAQLLFLSYGRQDERESDKLGVEYSAMEGYEAAEGGKFFTSLKRISKASGFDIPSHLSSHPDPGEREKNIPRMAAEWEEKGYEQTILNKEEFYTQIKDLMYGDNPRNGYVENNTFYHPDLKFEFAVPTGFNVVNQPTQVVLFNEEQSAITIFSIDSENNTPKASVEAVTANENITEQSSTPIVANGYQGYQAVAKAGSGEEELTVLITSINYDSRIYQFISYSSTANYSGFGNTFRLIPDSFNSVEDEAVLNVKPVRLQQVTVQESKAFSELLPADLPMQIEPRDIAILNQVELDEVIEAGRVIKIPAQY